MLSEEEKQIGKNMKKVQELKLNPPYDCPLYYSNWNFDDMCKNGNDYCQWCGFLGCNHYFEMMV